MSYTNRLCKVNNKQLQERNMPIKQFYLYKTKNVEIIDDKYTKYINILLFTAPLIRLYG